MPFVAGCGAKDGPRTAILPDGTLGSAITYWTGTGDLGKPPEEELERIIRLNDGCKKDEKVKFIAIEATPSGAGRKISSVFKCMSIR